jgi:TolA protein
LPRREKPNRPHEVTFHFRFWSAVIPCSTRSGITVFRSSTTFGNSVTDDASAYLDQVERRSMAVWKLPPNAKGLKVVIRLRLERSGRVPDVRVEKSSGDKPFDASAGQAVRRASPLPPAPDSAQSSLVGDLRMVLDPTRPVPEQFPGQKT